MSDGWSTNFGHCNCWTYKLHEFSCCSESHIVEFSRDLDNLEGVLSKAGIIFDEVIKFRTRDEVEAAVREWGVFNDNSLTEVREYADGTCNGALLGGDCLQILLWDNFPKKERFSKLIGGTIYSDAGLLVCFKYKQGEGEKLMHKSDKIIEGYAVGGLEFLEEEYGIKI